MEVEPTALCAHWGQGGVCEAIRLNNVPGYRFVVGFHINPTVNPARSGKPAR